jgi:hypothetical protein
MFEWERTSLLSSTFSHSCEVLDYLINIEVCKSETVVVRREFQLITKIKTIGVFSNIRACTPDH